MASRVYIVRHGETEWSRSGRHTGGADLPLTEHGADQGRAVAGTLAGIDFSLVLCSPLRRARETCRLAGLADAAQLCDDLREWDYGEYEGLTSAQIWQARPDWSLWRDGCPGGESPVQIGARVVRVLERIGEVDGDVACVAHGHVLRVLTARWLAMDVAAGARFAFAAAAIGQLGHEHSTRVIERWSA